VAASPSSRSSGSLNEELAVLRSFIAILQQEQQALVAGDLERLPPLVKEKTELAARLGQFAEQRAQMLAAAALPANHSGMESWLAHLDPADNSRAAWKNLQAQTIEAHALNESNGKLIAMRMQHNQQALNVLLAAANQANLYGPDGQTKPSGGGRLFGAA